MLALGPGSGSREEQGAAWVPRLHLLHCPRQTLPSQSVPYAAALVERRAPLTSAQDGWTGSCAGSGNITAADHSHQ